MRSLRPGLQTCHGAHNCAMLVRQPCRHSSRNRCFGKPPQLSPCYPSQTFPSDHVCARRREFIVPAAAAGAPRSAPPLLDPERLLQAISSAASRKRDQQRQQQPATPSEADLMFLDVAFAGSMAGFNAGAFSPMQIARLATDMATLASPPAIKAAGEIPQGWDEALLAAMQEQLSNMPGHALVQCLHALHTLRIDPGADWLVYLLQQSERQLYSMDATDLSRLVLGITALGYRPHDAWLDQVCARSLTLGLGTFRASELVELVSAVAACNYRPPDEWLEQLVFGALMDEPQFAAFSSDEAARMLWSICCFQVLPHPVWVKACYTQILVDMETLDPEWLCNVLWAIASLEVARPTPQDATGGGEGAPAQEGSEGGVSSFGDSYLPPSSWLQLLTQVCTPHVRTLGSVQVIKALWAAAALRLRPQPAWLLPLVERARQLLGSPSSAAPAPSGRDAVRPLEPLEVLYLARSGDALYGALTSDEAGAAGGGAGGAARVGAAPASKKPREPDEYDRLGPPAPLALLVREAYQAVTHLATASRMPPEWRKINVWYPPYALPQPQQPGMSAEGTDAEEVSLFGPRPPPGLAGPR